jgi:hypothetical protein
LAILTVLTLRTVFRLAFRQREGLIGSVIDLLGLGLRVPDHTTLSRRAARLAVPRLQPNGTCVDAQPVPLLVDSTGLKLCGAGEWLLEKHGTKMRRSWRKLHLGVDAETGQIVASALTSQDHRKGPQGLAASLRLQQARQGRGGDRPMEQVIGDGLRSRTAERRVTEVDVAVRALNRMLLQLRT